MKIILEVPKSKQTGVIKRISDFKETNFIRQTDDKIIVQLKNPVPFEDKGEIRKVETKYNVEGVDKVIISPVKAEKGSSEIKIKRKRCHCFFDIDSTLTKGDGTINAKVRTVFDEMKDNGFHIYFVSGRNIPTVRGDMNDFGTEPYGIAENGGVIIGLGKDGEYLHGDRTEPDKVLAYLFSNCNGVKEDIKQGFRKTEVILQNNVDEDKIRNYIKKSKAMVDCHASKTAYHITEYKKNKGTAVEKLISELRLKPNSLDVIMAIGDADMDVPLLEMATYSFAVGNASDKALASADVWLENSFADGIVELHEKLKELLLPDK